MLLFDTTENSMFHKNRHKVGQIKASNFPLNQTKFRLQYLHTKYWNIEYLCDQIKPFSLQYPRGNPITF